MELILRLVSFVFIAYLVTGCASSETVNAIRSDNFETFKVELAKEQDINAPYRDMTFLMWAASEGKTDMVSYLLQQGADINARDSFGYTGLFWAVYKGKEDVARLLIDKGADIHATDFQGDTSVILAAGAGSFPLVKTLVEKGVDINKADKRGNTPLTMAVGDGNIEMVNYLISKGANTNVQDSDGMSILMTAIKFDNFDIAKNLLRAKAADVNLKDKTGNTALLYAVIPVKVYPSFVENLDMVQALLDNGAEVNIQNAKGCTPLMIAAMCGAVSTVDLLMKKGADKSIRNRDARTALSFVEKPASPDELISRYLPNDGGKYKFTEWTNRDNYPAIAALLK